MIKNKYSKSRRGDVIKSFTAVVFAALFIFTGALPAVFAKDTDDSGDTEKIELSTKSAVTASDIGLDTAHVNGAFLYNIENDFTIFSFAAEDVVYPTATVKMMGGILAIEALGKRLYENVTVTEEMLAGVGGNKIGFKVGETLTVESLLYAMLVGGANDAAHILATLVAGSVDNFVLMMNQRAAAIGCKDTHYTNPSGIHDREMYTTTLDTAKIALEAYKLPLFMEITSTSKYVIPETNMNAYRNVYNRNYLISTSSVLKYYYKDAAGMNSGATSQGGYCLVTTAERDGLSYLCVIMGADIDEEKDVIYSYTEASKLLDYAFASYGNIDLVKKGEMICEIPVTLSGTTDYVTLVTAESMSMYLPTSTDLETEIKRSYKTSFESLTAPVSEGDVAGILTVLYHDEIVGNIDLVTTVAVARSEFLYTLEQIKEFATGRFFIAAVIAAAVLTVLYVLGKAIYLHKKTRYRGFYK